MRLVILFEDNEIWLSLSPEEFVKELSKFLPKKDLEKAMASAIAEIKRRTLHA